MSIGTCMSLRFVAIKSKVENIIVREITIDILPVAELLMSPGTGFGTVFTICNTYDRDSSIIQCASTRVIPYASAMYDNRDFDLSSASFS